jgi:hypothetical protein
MWLTCTASEGHSNFSIPSPPPKFTGRCPKAPPSEAHGAVVHLFVSMCGSTQLGLLGPSLGALWVESDFAKLLGRGWLVNSPGCEADELKMKHSQFARIVKRVDLRYSGGNSACPQLASVFSDSH